MLHEIMDLNDIWPEHCQDDEEYQYWNQSKISNIKEMGKTHNCLTECYDCQKLKTLSQMGKADDALVEMSPDEKWQECTSQYRYDIQKKNMTRV